MAEYTYTACDRTGASHRGRVRADSAESAGAKLDQRGLIPVAIKKSRTRSRGTTIRSRGAKWRIEEKILFTRKLGSLLRSGLPLLRTLDLVVEQTRDPKVATCLDHISEQISRGSTICDAMAMYPRLFDPTYLGAIRTGEATGKLDLVLEQMADHLEREMVTRRMVKATVRYPILVVAAMVVAGTAVVTFVVPRFMSFYTHFGGELPGPTRLLLAISHILQSYWWIMPPLALLGWLGWRGWTRTENGRWWRDRSLLRMPIFGILFLKVAVTRFARLFGILFSAGVPAANALSIVSDGVGNVLVAKEINAMRDRLSAGDSPATMPPAAVMPRLVYQMLAIGFETGDVERMLGEVARHYDQEIEYDVRRLRDHIEPIILVVLTIGVLLIALAVLLPIWNLPALLNR